MKNAIKHELVDAECRQYFKHYVEANTHANHSDALRDGLPADMASALYINILLFHMHHALHIWLSNVLVNDDCYIENSRTKQRIETWLHCFSWIYCWLCQPIRPVHKVLLSRVMMKTEDYDAITYQRNEELAHDIEDIVELYGNYNVDSMNVHEWINQLSAF